MATIFGITFRRNMLRKMLAKCKKYYILIKLNCALTRNLFDSVFTLMLSWDWHACMHIAFLSNSSNSLFSICTAHGSGIRYLKRNLRRSLLWANVPCFVAKEHTLTSCCGRNVTTFKHKWNTTLILWINILSLSNKCLVRERCVLITTSFCLYIDVVLKVNRKF